MIVYRRDSRVLITEAALQAMVAGSTHSTAEDLLIDFGEFEAGLADAAGRDNAMARSAALILGRALSGYESWRGAFGDCLRTLAGLALPARLKVSTPEGYAYYGLYPQAYAAAARDLFHERRPSCAAVIGIRSIGTSLSAVVGGALVELGCRVVCRTVRPSGHPWERKLEFDGEEAAALAGCGASVFAIVDEGPGISGSSMASVAEALSGLGIDDGRIVFLPAWDAPPEALRNQAARKRWSRHRRYTSEYLPSYLKGMRDLSAGAWREVLYPGDRSRYPAVQPQHEAWKFLSSDGTTLFKFSGIGRYGGWKLERQRALADAGFSTAPAGSREGFLAMEFAPGRPLEPAALSSGLLDHMARYLAYRSRTFPAAGSLSFEEMIEMVAVNLSEAGRPDITARFEPLAGQFGDRPAVEVDARMMPHEWIRENGNLIKTDAVDHHAGHFVPGCADIAWDLAGAAFEWRLDATATDYLVSQYERFSGDRVPRDLLSFYSLAYMAFRVGYAGMAAGSTAGTEDEARFRQIQNAASPVLEHVYA